MFKYLRFFKCFGFRYSIFGFLALLITTSLIPPVKAQKAISPSIGVSPILVRRNVEPGQSQEVKITLTNYGSDPIPLGIVKSTISAINDDGSPEFTSVVGPQSADNWITPTITDLILPAHSSADVALTILPPKTVAPGGYNAAIQFQAKLPSFYFDLDANARVLPALSVSILLTVDAANPPTVKDLTISQLDAPSVVLSAPIPLVTQVNNPTNFFIFTDGSLTLQPAFGSDKTVTSLKNSIVLPNSSRKFVNAYTGSIWPGIYKATLSLQQSDKTLVASARFVAIPWPFLLIFIILIIFFFSFLGRRRFRQAYRVLVGKPSGVRRPTIR